jgi:3-isopropylmalate/(R)-2-methylmalate dehydratase small subunit
VSKPTRVRGRAWVIRDQAGEAIDDIDTDMIFHNAHLAVTERAQMAQYAFGNLEGWKDFSKRARPGDLLVVGENFGAGSSRQQAVDCFLALGIAAVLGESFGAIYKRNAINAGLPLLACANIAHRGRQEPGYVESGDQLEVDFVSGEIRNLGRGEEVPLGEALSGVQLDIYQAGDLFRYGLRCAAGAATEADGR